MPEGARIKKVCHGKFFRLVLTDDNNLWHSGQTRRYMAGSNVGRDSHFGEFHLLHSSSNNFMRLESDEHIVDMCGGKSHLVVITNKGRVHSNGYLFYRYVTGAHRNTINEDHPCQLALPDGWFAEKIWAVEKYFTIFCTAHKTDNPDEKRTFCIGQDSLQIKDGSSNHWGQVKLPEGKYFTHVASQLYTAFGVDNDGILYTWGNRVDGNDTSHQN